MTSLLVTRPDRTGTDDTRRRPLVLIAVLGGLLAAAGPLLVLLALGVVGWFASDAGVHGAPRDGMRAGALAWLAAHGSGLGVMGVRVTVVPLGITAVCAWTTWRTALRVGDAVSGHGPDADRISDGERDFTVPAAVAAFLAAYAVVAVVTHGLASGDAAPSLPRVLAWSVLMVGAVTAPAVAVGSGRAAIWATFVPGAVRAGLAVAWSVAVTFLVVATLLFLVALVADLDEAATMMARLHTSPAEAGLYSLVSAAFLPNAAAFAGSWLLGPGFLVGAGTLVSPALTVLGPLPVFPPLAALPAAGQGSGAMLAVVALPPLVSAVAAARVLRDRPLLRWDQAALAGTGGGIVAGVLVAVVAAVSGGAAGPGRMRLVGPEATAVLFHAVTVLGLGGLVGAVLVTVWQRRRTAPAAP